MPVGAGWTCVELADRLVRTNAKSTLGLDVLGPDLAADLARGIVAPDRALLAARVLDLAGGRTALGEALATTDAHKRLAKVLARSASQPPSQ